MISPGNKDKIEATIIIYYDDFCGLCNRWIKLLKKYGALKNVDYRALNESPKKIQELSQKNNAWIIERKGEYFVGYAGFVECMKQSRIFFLLGYIGSYQPLCFIGNRVYRYISSNRNCHLNKKPTGEK